MKRWKLVGLAVSGGFLLQVGACWYDFAYFLAQAFAAEAATQIVNTATGA